MAKAKGKGKVKKVKVKPKAKGKPKPKEKKKEIKIPSWFDIEEIKRKGVDEFAREHGLDPRTVRRTINKAGYSMKDVVRKEVVELDEETMREFYQAKRDFEGRAGRKINDLSFEKVLLSLYKIVSKEG